MSFKNWQQKHNPILYRESKRIKATSNFFVGDIVNLHGEGYYNGIVISKEEASKVWGESVARGNYGENTIWIRWPNNIIPLQSNQRDCILVSRCT